MKMMGVRFLLKEQLLSLEMKAEIVKEMISNIENMEQNRDIIQELEILKNDFLQEKTYLDGLSLSSFSVEDRELFLGTFDVLIKSLKGVKKLNNTGEDIFI